MPSHWSRFISENRVITFLLDNKSYCLKAVILNLLPTAALPSFCHNKTIGRTHTLLPQRYPSARAGEWRTGSFPSPQTQVELSHTQSEKKYTWDHIGTKKGWGRGAEKETQTETSPLMAVPDPFYSSECFCWWKAFHYSHCNLGSHKAAVSHSQKKDSSTISGLNRINTSCYQFYDCQSSIVCPSE